MVSNHYIVLCTPVRTLERTAFKTCRQNIALKVGSIYPAVELFILRNDPFPYQRVRLQFGGKPVRHHKG